MINELNYTNQQYSQNRNNRNQQILSINHNYKIQ